MGRFITALGIGAAAGAAIALLYAPQSGERTRRQLRRGMEDAGERIRDTAGTVSDCATKYYKKGREAVGDVVDTAQNVVTAAKKAANFS
jgi:gas vesicle protein